MNNNTKCSVELDLSTAPMTLIRYRKQIPVVAFIYHVKPNIQRVIAVAEVNGERLYITTTEQLAAYINDLRKGGFIVQQPNFQAKPFVPNWSPPLAPKPKVRTIQKQSQLPTAEVTFTEDVALAL